MSNILNLVGLSHSFNIQTSPTSVMHSSNYVSIGITIMDNAKDPTQPTLKAALEFVKRITQSADDMELVVKSPLQTIRGFGTFGKVKSSKLMSAQEYKVTFLVKSFSLEYGPNMLRKGKIEDILA